MVTEVRRSVEYYVNRFPDSAVDKILLYGGTARMPNFADFVGNETGVPVEVGNPFARLIVQDGNVSPEMVEQDYCFMPIVVGLAIRDMLE
jgi:type IV pilus assembly protein PilM